MHRLIEAAIGDLTLLNRKHIYTALVHAQSGTCPNDWKLQMVKQVKDTPKFEIDYQVFTAVRTRCLAEFTTGNMIKSETESFINLDNFPQDQQSRLEFIVSNSLKEEDLGNLPLFKQKQYQFVITRNQHLKLFEARRIAFIPPFENMRDAVQYYQRKYDLQTFYNLGPQTIKYVYDLMDLYILTVYEGSFPTQFHAGLMPNFKTLQSHLKQVHTSEKFPQLSRTIQFFVFTK